MDCLFCKIINNEMKSYTLYEDEYVKVFLDAYPESDGHTLIVPKKHYTTFQDLDEEILCHIFKIAKKYTEILMEKLDVKGLTTLYNFGDAQAIKHFHLHLIPNFLHQKGEKKEISEIYEILMK